MKKVLVALSIVGLLFATSFDASAHRGKKGMHKKCCKAKQCCSKGKCHKK